MAFSNFGVYCTYMGFSDFANHRYKSHNASEKDGDCELYVDSTWG